MFTPVRESRAAKQPKLVSENAELDNRQPRPRSRLLEGRCHHTCAVVGSKTMRRNLTEMAVICGLDEGDALVDRQPLNEICSLGVLPGADLVQNHVQGYPVEPVRESIKNQRVPPTAVAGSRGEAVSSSGCPRLATKVPDTKMSFVQHKKGVGWHQRLHNLPNLESVVRPKPRLATLGRDEAGQRDVLGPNVPLCRPQRARGYLHNWA